MKFYENIIFKLCGIILLFLIPLCGFSQGSGTLRGTIKNQQEDPVVNATIFIPDLETGSNSDLEGNFSMSSLPSGTYRVIFSRLGYAKINRKITIRTGDTTSIEITMASSDLEMETVTVTGTPTLTDPLESTAEVDIISGSQKFETQQPSLGKSVNQIAGVHTINTGNQSGKPVIRGLSGNRIRGLHNSVAMDYQQYGVRHMPPMDPFLARRIELVQGPSSILYGSDAMGGAINFIPMHAHTDVSGKGFLRGDILGDFQFNNRQGTGGLNLKGSSGSWGFAGGLVHRSAGNMHTPGVRTFSDPNGQAGDPRFSGTLDHTDFSQTNGTITAGHSDDYGNVALNYTRWGNEHNFLLPDGEGLGQFIGNDILQVNSTIILNKAFKFKPKFSYLRNLRQSNPEGETRNSLPARNERAHLDILRKAYSGRFELVNTTEGALSGTMGIELRRTDQETRGIQEPLVPSAVIDNIGIFAFEEASFEEISFSAGLRFDHIKQEAEPNNILNLPDDDETAAVLTQDYSVFSGSFGVNYRFTDHLSASANLGKGFRAPSIFELHADGIHGGVAAYQKGNPALEPETNINTDFSLKWRSPDLKAKISLYNNAISNYIFLVNRGENSREGLPILESIQGDALLQGGHISTEGQILSWLNIEGYLEIVKGSNNDDDLEGIDELPLMPANKYGGKVKFELPEISFIDNPYISIGFDHAFAKEAAGRYEPFWQFDQAIPFGVASTDAYTVLNARIGMEIPMENNPVNLLIYSENLTNNAYRNFLDTYKGYALSPGRNIGIRVNVPVNFL